MEKFIKILAIAADYFAKSMNPYGDLYNQIEEDKIRK